MSPLGHSLVGIGFALLTPSVAESFEGQSKKSHPCKTMAINIACFIGLANLPDWPLPYWGHQRYGISHSLLVNCLLIVCVVFAARSLNPKKQERVAESDNTAFNQYLLLGALAWLSHLLLDSFYNHGEGVMIGWPFSQTRLAMPIPWLTTLDVHQSMLSEHNLLVATYEAITFLPWVMVAMLIRFRLSRCIATQIDK